MNAGNSNRAAYESSRKRIAREQRMRARVQDARYPGRVVMVSTLKACPHGTDRGYVEYGCRCLDLGPLAPDPDADDPSTAPWKPTGCRRAGVTAAAMRRASRRAVARGEPTNPSGSALAQLDHHRLMGAPPKPRHQRPAHPTPATSQPDPHTRK